MPERRVAVTGLGAVSALGIGIGALWERMMAGQGGIGPLDPVLHPGLGFRNGAVVREFLPGDHFPSRQVDLMDRVSQFALVAAREAVKDANLSWADPVAGRRTAVVTGSCSGSTLTEDAAFRRLYGEDQPQVHPFTIPRIMHHAAAAWIAMEFGIRGPSLNFATACSASSHAIGHAFRMVRSGDVDHAVAGGAEAPFSLGNLKAWDSLRVVAPEACRPFSLERRGLVLGEGAAFLVLESMESARFRGARIHAEIVGFGMSSDAHHLTHPLAEGAVNAMQGALRDAGMAPGEIGHVNAHGTATQVNDRVESEALRSLFGTGIRNVLVTSTKSAHGHALGATGALEAIATILSIREGWVPPTIGFGTPDPHCDIPVVHDTAAPWDGRAALSNSFAFGGTNSVLAFRGVGG